MPIKRIGLLSPTELLGLKTILESGVLTGLSAHGITLEEAIGYVPPDPYIFDPVAWAREVLSFEPDPWQERVLRSQSKRLLVLCSRQAGKSMIAAILALHRAIYQPGSLVLMVSRSERQAGELFRKVLDKLATMPDRPKCPEDNKRSIELPNRSRIVALPGSEETVRGFSGVALIIEDEAARVPDELYHAIRPMLAVSDGQLILMSTPWGRRGHFYQEWTEGGQTWERYLIQATQCSRIGPEFLAEELRSLPETWFRSEYLCEFTDTVDAVFPSELIDAAISEEIEAW